MFVVPGNKKSRTRETKHPSTDVDSSTNTENPASKAKFVENQTFFLRGDFTPIMRKSIQI